MTYAIIIGIVAVIFFLLYKKPEHHEYKATFGNPGDHLSFWNKGFALGSRAFTKKLSVTNCIVLGPTGSGKSTVVTIPCAKALGRGNSSIIFNDVSGELWDRTSGYLAAKGYTILRLDFSNAGFSESFNPLQECKTISDIQKLCLIIFHNAVGESKGNDPFWEQASIGLLSLFCRYLVFHTECKYRTLQNLQRLVEQFAVEPNSIDVLMVRTNDEALLAAYKATLVMGEKTMQSVIATTRTSLHLLNDPEVCKVTATNSINFNMLREKPVAIYVNNPLKDLKYFKPLSALFFQALFNFVLTRIPRRDENAIFFILDEFATYRFPDMAITVSNCRKYSAGLLLCMQDEMSLIAQYGAPHAHQIKTNCGIQVYLKGSPLHTCKELSQALGKYTYIDEKGTSKVRELMTPDEIRMTDAAIVLVNNKAPLRVTPVPYYKSIWLQNLRRIEPYQLQEKQVTEPPLISFPKTKR